ncbi:hypothetical protein TGRUB_310940 [Toxoplasma gondii RUB]|uniref:Uncharacterized protein n=1 Tax=Toxoplasma gondii RUB TaxID=935652 RepID=A0A086MAF1_TOXGO|nr:hypothetical protein TGRUB_310940 [Toxoplasma gondii RUB]
MLTLCAAFGPQGKQKQRKSPRAINSPPAPGNPVSAPAFTRLGLSNAEQDPLRSSRLAKTKMSVCLVSRQVIPPWRKGISEKSLAKRSHTTASLSSAFSSRTFSDGGLPGCRRRRRATKASNKLLFSTVCFRIWIKPKAICMQPACERARMQESVRTGFRSLTNEGQCSGKAIVGLQQNALEHANTPRACTP